MNAWGVTGRVRTERFSESDYEVSVDGTYAGWFGARDRRWVAGLGFDIDAEGFPTDDHAVMWVLRRARPDVWRAERPVVWRVYRESAEWWYADPPPPRPGKYGGAFDLSEWPWAIEWTTDKAREDYARRVAR